MRPSSGPSKKSACVRKKILMKPKDYFYDIPMEDLRRYSRLRPAEILRWLEEHQKFLRMAARSGNRRSKR